ncbi:DUF5327 family protein [Alteribacter aurantiacus]|uniref:DUF5327 family protein n=1 Tax=Alteribacter aurantiacus TaxID=254410 RepID=UPI000415D4D2|nr:DUF5327 family protein [Alteribacter aurantiacus]
MNISAKTVVAKMEQELGHVRRQVNTGDPDFKEHVMALKTYCDLLLATEPSSGIKTSTKNEDAMDLLERQRMMGDFDDTPKTKASQKKSVAYDSDDQPDSDSLFDF